MPGLSETYKVQSAKVQIIPYTFELCRVQKAQVRRSEKQNSHRLPWNQHSSTASPRQFWGFLGPSTAMKAPSQPTKLKIVHAWVFWTLQSSKYQGPEPYTVFFLNVPQTSQSSRANLTVSFFPHTACRYPMIPHSCEEEGWRQRRAEGRHNKSACTGICQRHVSACRSVPLGGKCARSYKGNVYKVQGFATKFKLGWKNEVKIQSLFPRHVGV